jgi:hypothetical protein
MVHLIMMAIVVAALLVIASGVWVAIGLVATLAALRDHADRDTPRPDDLDNAS